MTKRLFATSLFIFLFVSNASAWDMGAYIENAQAGEGKIDSSAVQKIEQKQPEDADSSMALTEEKKQQIINNHVYRGLYFSAEVAFGYTSLNYSVNNRSGKSDQKFSGLSFPYAEIRFGHYFANIVSVYGALGIGIGTGKYEGPYPKRDEDKIDAVSFRGLLGLGAEVYPFQDKESALYGIFFGIFFGAAIEGVDVGKATILLDEKRSDKKVGYHNIFGRIEAGYDWWFSTRWRAGVAFNYSYGKIDDDWETNTNHSFNFTIRIAR